MDSETKLGGVAQELPPQLAKLEEEPKGLPATPKG